jgi:hypothetical protein
MDKKYQNLENLMKKRAITPTWVIGFTSKLPILTCCTFLQFKLNIYLYSFWNIRRTVLKLYKFDEKRAITPRWVIRFTQLCCQGRIQEGAHLARANHPPPLKIGKKYNFWLKIMIFHTKYPKHFRASLPSAQLF